jgi:hypothetical protein
MKIIEVIESKCWQNKITGATASIYGSVPYFSDKDKQDWEVITRGYTWRLDNGTVGLGRMPANTMSEAIEIMNNFNNRG